MRKLATIQTISAIDPIEGADRIQKAKILGWNIVVGKDDFQVGEKAVYFEIDSFLPATEPAFEAFQARGQKTVPNDGVDVTGHVLRTVKLRGVISQGLLMPLGKLAHLLPEGDLEVGTDVTDDLGIFKYEAPIPMGGNIVGPFDSRFAPKTDAIRVQSLSESFDLIKGVDWVPTVKVDGTSTTLVNDEGTLRVFGRNWELDSTATPMVIAKEFGLTEVVPEGGAIQFELTGEGIQSNRLKLSGKRPIVFAVWDRGVKVPQADWPERARELATPNLGDEFLPKNFATAEDLVSFVDGLRGSVTKDLLDEGVVYHPVDPASVPAELREVLDRNMNFKVISQRFLLKYSE